MTAVYVIAVPSAASMLPPIRGEALSVRQCVAKGGREEGREGGKGGRGGRKGRDGGRELGTWVEPV